MEKKYPRPRGRPTIPEQEIRQKIHDVTLSLLFTQGYSTTTMDVVAQKAGIAKKTLYRFVKNREDLLEQIVLRWTDSCTPTFEKDASSFKQAMKLLEKHLREIAQKLLSTDAVGLFKLLQSNFPFREVLLEKYQKSVFERDKIILANWLERQYQKGLLRKLNYNIISELVLSMVIAEPLRQMALGITPPLPETDITPHLAAAITLLELSLVKK
ncbi:TetR/AcrR family transcriptional regulator [Xenorhabdus bovienii]|uniref:TetR/AcrR family transcriptional regulator n=3 Tax=Xenorhabdus bovienii TaxID=40576 RepID=A0AAJ1J6D8_XENBV|nr:TetR/AcrR family transcriptional regulator [Xenorhabdus bovienii]MDE1474363.1 TetR/AcrR family transcriptional regulator [Xenorhabdus bovienii]MDE1477960.1 TetR/AcrR family transcriptional regulator [Xenorhabdus bovienii]MDE1482365.1 TetR/AcrR family transcriptional regulator [Xenorhabdus bovienii]MDE1486643.1 TetR/AcrR family transcriptional regulator [Xenorhabdus bovienii]MDE1490755.1 TetR/AcrR family transcriptional regulator [Xenorhabdus bovienii]